ncbi:MAG: hypothetical protein KKD01_01265 [Proteobacteria bacterium]|nr:hypothetical protein [Pseudomonadota bacterium]MBU1418267.1 hypothetical protein [Pseudomonadota bacterium]MBU1453329.1 hypothetical protein [Pseudomonadota bacterium]
MNIWDESKLIIFIAFVVPGFIAIKAYELLSPSRYTDSSKQIIDAISYSCLNYAILLWPIYLVETSKLHTSNPHLYILFYIFVMFVFPLFLVFGWKHLRQFEFIQNHVPHPTQKPWDFVFGQRLTYWVTVTLKNGEKIAGMYGPNSFASSAPADEQIYLEEYWLLNKDGGFERPVDQTAGILILSSEIVSVELMNSGEYGNEQKEQ